MRFNFIVGAILVVGSLPAISRPLLAQADSTASVKAVMKSEEIWWKGEMTGDTAAMARLMAPNFESYDPSQGGIGRDEQLKMIRPDTAGEQEQLSNWKIRDYGPTVVATADYRITQTGKPGRQMTVVDVWSQGRGGWRLVFATYSNMSVIDSTK